jgi:ligand-binding sensor domain-containing protein/signal transduction histidine kinase
LTLLVVGPTGVGLAILGLAVAVLFVAQPSVAAQEFQVRNWHVADGLPDGTVTSLAQTPDGYLWVGTPKGLARFDGDSFTRVESVRDSALRDPSVVGLLTDRQGGLWIASESGLITQFAEGKFRVRYPPEAAALEAGAPAARPPNAQAWRTLNSIFALDGAGAVWAATVTGEVVRFAGPGAPVAVPLGEFPGGRVRGLANDGTGRVWLLKGTNACVFEDGRWTFSAAAGILVTSGILCPAGDRGFWTAGVSSSQAFAKLVQYRRDEGWNVLSLPIPTTPARPPVSAMLQDRQGRVWLAKVWGGVYVQLREGEWEHVQATGPLAKGTVRCLFEDRHGSIWVGTTGQGLHQVLDSSVKMVLLPPEAADVHVTTVCAAKDGSLWMGTDKGLYCRAQGEAARVSAVEGLSEESIFAVLEDTRTNLWVATQSGVFRREDSGFKKALALPLSYGGILALYEDRAGGIWAGGYHGSLLHLPGGPNGAAFEPKTGKPVLMICCIAEDDRGQIWVGSKKKGTGLWRVVGKELVPEGPQLAGIDPIVRSVLYDKDGVLWIGTQGDGLFRWSDKVLQRYTTADGLPDDVILGLMADDQGNLWMTSQAGILGCSRRQLAEYVRGQSTPLLCMRLGLDEGLANRECTGAGQPVISRGPDGRFWVATMVGAAGFSPKMLTRLAPAAEVRVEALSADGLALPPEAQGFRVPASTRRFEFRYSVPEFASPKALHFRYRLDGLDRYWVEAGPGRRAAYSQLPPGEYHFRVMAGGADGVWREAKMPVTLRVVPRFWQTGWFGTLAVVTTVIALVGGVALNERRKARRRLERLEAQQAIEQVRRRIARDLHDDLGSAITEIVQLGDLTLQPESARGTLRSSMETMTGLVRQLGITVDEIVWTMSSRNDTLPNLAGYISNHAQEFFRHSGIRCRLDVTKNLPGVGVNSQTRHNLFLAVKEALNNVAKHSGADKVMVRVHYDEGVLRVSIEDNGRGFDAAAVRQGEGLTNMRERLEAVKGQVEFARQADHGARVVFTLALAGPPGRDPGDPPH